MSRSDEIPASAAVYEARNAVFWLHDGVMFGRHKLDKPRITLEDAITVIQKLKEMSGGRPVPILFDGRGLAWLNIEARGYVRAHVPEVFTQAAIVVKHDLVRILTHAFMGVAGSEIPMEFFTDEEDAWQYLSITAS